MIFGIDAADRRTRPALFDSELNRWWTYTELTEQVARRASLLPSNKSLVFLFCTNTADSIAWYAAALDSGNAIALLPNDMTAEARAPLIDAYQPDAIITDEGAPAHPYEQSTTPRVWHRRRTNVPAAIHAELSLLLTTSGSTGNPKFVRLRKNNVEANAVSICFGLAITPDDRAITSLPMNYSYGLSVINTHLLAGASLVLTNAGLVNSAFWDLFRAYECTSLAGVPYSYQILRRLRPDTLNIPSLNTMTQAGGKLENTLISEFHDFMMKRSGRFFVMYGQTEATARICILPSAELPAKLGSVGPPIQGGRVEIASSPRGPELVYFGPNVMMGYAFGRDDLARGDELGGRLDTGDIAEIDADGYISIAKRSTREAKVFGLRVNLDDVELMLRGYGPNAAISSGERLIIFCENGDEATLSECRLYLARKLNVHHSAFEFRRIDKLPLNTSGKIDYRSLSAAE